jgi:imidazole glycerol-phosphate synthase subunit HisH
VKNNIKIVIIDYGLGNLASIKNVLEKLNVNSIVSNEKQEIESANALILPGVGAFGDAMINIKSLRLDKFIHNFVSSGRPLLGICLGFQLLFEKSEEFGEHLGLGILPGRVVKFPVFVNDLKTIIPNVGWQKVTFLSNDFLFNRDQENKSRLSEFYFVHSFYVEYGNPFMTSYSNYYGVKFVSSVQKENVYGVQFHPEKSGEIGINLIKKFINIVEAHNNG